MSLRLLRPGFDQMTPTASLQMSHRWVTNVPMFHALRGEAVVWVSSFVMTSISRSYPNHASIPLSVFPFNCQWATPRTLFFIPCTGPPMSPKPTLLGNSALLLSVLLYHVAKILSWRTSICTWTNRMFGHKNSVTPSVNAILPRSLTLKPTFMAMS